MCVSYFFSCTKSLIIVYVYIYIYIYIYTYYTRICIYMYVYKVKFTLEEATKAHTGSKSVALLFP